MSYYLAQISLSLIASIGFGIIFNAPRKALPHCGLVGMGWTCRYGWLDDVLNYDRCWH